jgi:hypothetical protein
MPRQVYIEETLPKKVAKPVLRDRLRGTGAGA